MDKIKKKLVKQKNQNTLSTCGSLTDKPVFVNMQLRE